MAVSWQVRLVHSGRVSETVRRTLVATAAGAASARAGATRHGLERGTNSSDLDIYKSPGPPPHSRVVVLDTVVKK